MFQPIPVVSSKTSTVVVDEASSIAATAKLEEPEDLIIGLSLPQPQQVDAYNLHGQCTADGFVFCTTELPQNVYQLRHDVTLLQSYNWRTGVVGVFEPLPTNNKNPSFCGRRDENWKMPLEWAWHLELPVVIVPPLPTMINQHLHGGGKQEDAVMSEGGGLGGSDGGGDTIVDPPLTTSTTTTGESSNQLPLLWEYARKVGEGSLQAKRVNGHLWIVVTLPGSMEEAQAILHQWKTLDQLLDHPANIGLLLDMKYSTSNQQQQQPNGSNNNESKPPLSSVAWGKLQVIFLHHLMGMATIRGLRFCCSDFLTNKGGFPTLSRGVQFVTAWLLQRLGDRSLRLLVQGPPTHFTTTAAQQSIASAPANILGSTGCLPYFQYLQHIRKRPDIRAVLDTEQARLEEPHCERLQQPLQPLRDHLDNGTYEVFEGDPVKYREYQRAISMALTDFVRNGNSGSSGEPKVVLVVGAGRGPLVTCVVQAYADLPPDQRPQFLTVWAIEKNPSAIIYLQSLILQQQQEKWRNLPVQVQMVHADLRNLTSAVLNNQQADLIVSELLGSFGDNELSPECLDVLFTKTNVCHANTVSIPTKYTAYLAPVSSMKLYQKVREQALFPNDGEGTNGEGNGVLGLQVATETPYVVRPRAGSQIGPALPCWTFSHPNLVASSQEGSHNNNTKDENRVPMSIPNDWNRSAFLEFLGEHGSISPRWGCGYGPLDETVATMLDDDLTTNANDNIGSKSGGSGRVEEHSGNYQNKFTWLLTGFLGTFSADLYVRPPVSSLSPAETVTISTVPETFSKGMYSWFPLYFPLDQPLQVPGGVGSSQKVAVYAHVSRHSSPTANRVWYEWSAMVQDKATGSVLDSSAIHNPRGRSSFVSSM